MHQQLQHQLDRAQRLQQALVQVRVLNTQGSTYRKSGARMLINEQGQQFDLISGGCLESHLLRHAMQVFEDAKPITLQYDFSDPDAPDWLLSVGCRGKVVILLEKLSPANNYGSLALYLQARRARQPSWLVTDLEHGQSQRLSQQPQGAEGLVIEAIDPAPRLLLIGTGPDTDAIIELARNLDYQVQIIGCQSQSLHAFHHRYPNLAKRIEAHDLDSYLAANPTDYAIVMTHNQQLDAAYLSQTSLADLALVGLLGPAERKQRVIAQMHRPAPINLAAPMGLDLGGQGTQAVALSVMAQIQALEHQMLAQPLASKHGGIHD
ncbi:MAG: XdhC family protein [Gammaproteobacteria bacterium]|jgi:xanthine/CO dehydrogenase XdhC/CoxF family maturation factor|nr:XdhC family protein [Gammaproteobacteria bacterium]